MIKIAKSLLTSRKVTERINFAKFKHDPAMPEIIAGCDTAGCLKCASVCPVGAIGFKGIDSKLCINCGRCLVGCPVEKIKATAHPVIVNDEEFISNNDDEDIIDHEKLKERLKKVCGGSLHVRYVDTGACNGCDFEIGSTMNPIYDIQQYGVDFVASPRHADMLLVTGVVGRNMAKALMRTYDACPQPVLVVAVGACACGGGMFANTYASGGGVFAHIPVDVFVPGCPPAPERIIAGILRAVENRRVLKK